VNFYIIRIPVRTRFSAPAQTGPEAHPASCTMGTRSFPRVKSARSVTLTPHPLLEPWSRKSRAITLLPLWAVRPVQSLNTCTRAHFTFLLLNLILKIWNVAPMEADSQNLSTPSQRDFTKRQNHCAVRYVGVVMITSITWISIYFLVWYGNHLCIAYSNVTLCAQSKW